MKLLTLGIYSILLSVLAAFNIGCEPYHRHAVGVELEINSKDHADHHDNGKHKGDRHRHGDDDDHHDRDDHSDDH